MKEVAKFYASYLKQDPTDSQWGVPFGCAQEICDGRQAGGYHPQKDDTIDLAYARWLLTKAVQWGRELGEANETTSQWQVIADGLKPYALSDQHAYPASDKEEWCAASDCVGWSEAIDSDGNQSAIMYANYMW